MIQTSQTLNTNDLKVNVADVDTAESCQDRGSILKRGRVVFAIVAFAGCTSLHAEAASATQAEGKTYSQQITINIQNGSGESPEQSNSPSEKSRKQANINNKAESSLQLGSVDPEGDNSMVNKNEPEKNSKPLKSKEQAVDNRLETLSMPEVGDEPEDENEPVEDIKPSVKSGSIKDEAQEFKDYMARGESRVNRNSSN